MALSYLLDSRLGLTGNFGEFVNDRKALVTRIALTLPSGVSGKLSSQRRLTMTQKYDPQRSQDRPTEDDIAQAELGGVKGSPKLRPAPLTKQEAEQNLPNDEPGHVA